MEALYNNRYMGNAAYGGAARKKGTALWQGNSAQSAAGAGNQQENIRSLKRMLSSANTQEQKQTAVSNNTWESMSGYRDSLRASREKTKDTSLKVKKVRYSYKALSSKILRCKTSYSARQVASQAKREVMRLKRQRKEEGIDEEELENAITHAKSMERVAKKKARHLEEEEIAKISGGACAGGIEDREEETSDEKRLSDDEAQDEMDEALYARGRRQDVGEDERLLSADELMEAFEMPKLTDTELTDMMNEMMAEMSEELRTMLEDMGLDELMEDMSLSPERDMDPADLKMMKIKHRNREMKDIVEADAKYLKAVFDKLEREKAGGGAAAIGQPAQTMGTPICSGADGVVVAVGASAPAPTVSIDISI